MCFVWNFTSYFYFCANTSPSNPLKARFQPISTAIGRIPAKNSRRLSNWDCNFLFLGKEQAVQWPNQNQTTKHRKLPHTHTYVIQTKAEKNQKQKQNNNKGSTKCLQILCLSVCFLCLYEWSREKSIAVCQKMSRREGRTHAKMTTLGVKNSKIQKKI